MSNNRSIHCEEQNKNISDLPQRVQLPGLVLVLRHLPGGRLLRPLLPVLRQSLHGAKEKTEGNNEHFTQRFKTNISDNI